MRKLLILAALGSSIIWTANAQTPSVTINGTPPPYTFNGTGVTQIGQTFTFSSSGGGDAITSPHSTLAVGGSAGATTLDLAGAAGQIMAGATPALTSTPTLGASGTLGSLTFGNATSGTVTIEPVTGALGTVTASFPANTGTIAETNLAQTFSALQTFGTNISIGGVTAAGATGTGNVVFATSPTLTSPALGTPASGVITNLTGTCTSCISSNTSATSNSTLVTLSGLSLPAAQVTGLGTLATIATGTLTNGDFCTYASVGPTISCNSSSSASISFPQTVAGTVTSGGIPYFSTPTQMSSSAILAANHILVGGGAGTAPSSDSNLDDGVTNANTLTYTGSGGITAPQFNTSGGSVHGLTIPAGTAPTGVAGSVIYTSDATSGFAEVNENNTGLSRVCTAANGICTGSGTVTDGAGSTTANQLALATSSAHVITYATILPTAAMPALTGDVTNSSGSLATTVGKINGGAVPTSTPVIGTNSSGQPVAATTITSLSFQEGAPGSGTALTTGPIAYITIPKACTLTSWDIMVDAGTATVQTWKIATGTAIPTVTQTISTSGVSISTGTAIHSATLTDFTTTAFAAHDIVAANLGTVSGADYINFQLEFTCAQ